MVQLAQNRSRLLAQTHALAAPILGENNAIEAVSEVGAFGSVGSSAVGAFAQVAPADGWLVRAGLASQRAEFGGAGIERQTMLGGQVRYMFGTESAWSPYAELGGWTTISARYRFTRNYVNGAGTAVGTAEAEGRNRYTFGRVGTAYAVSKNDQLSGGVEVGRARLSTDGYQESTSPSNPFPATVAASRSQATVVKLGAHWDHSFGTAWTSSLFARKAWTSSRRIEANAIVPGFGQIGAQPAGATNWLEYGARLGLKLSPSVTVDVFVDGIHGNRQAGSDTHYGADVRIAF